MKYVPGNQAVGSLEPPLDAARETYTLRWDDGTEATPDCGFDAIRDYFTTEIISKK